MLCSNRLSAVSFGSGSAESIHGPWALPGLGHVECGCGGLVEVGCVMSLVSVSTSSQLSNPVVLSVAWLCYRLPAGSAFGIRKLESDQQHWTW